MEPPRRAGRAEPAPPCRATRLMGIVAWSGGALFVGSLCYFLYSYLYRFGRAVPDGPVLPAAAADWLLFSLFAAHHSVFARTPAKAWVRRILPPALERSIYTVIASLMFIAVCWWWQPVPGVLYRLDQPLRGVAYAVQAAGIVLTFLGARALDVLDLAGIRAVLRARTDAGPGDVRLSTDGVFGIVRHPLYFGWALFVCAAPDMTATRAVFALVSSAYVAIAISWEERGLVEAFGAEYERYRRRVKWRMIPFLY
jgi:protein-S-isoprenylcysteine O-methyltransferase Ste14